MLCLQNMGFDKMGKKCLAQNNALVKKAPSTHAEDMMKLKSTNAELVKDNAKLVTENANLAKENESLKIANAELNDTVASDDPKEDAKAKKGAK